MPPELVQLQAALATGLFAAERLWAPLQTANAWIQRAARVLANEAGADAATVEQVYRGMLEEVLTHQADPAVAAWATHFYNVTRRYWRGLFHCYNDPAIPRTNNDLEQYFGAARHHERRATGQKRPTSAVAVRGAVRVVAAVATHVTPWSAQDLRPADVTAWRRLRAELEARHERRRAQRRFRRDPDAYLSTLEVLLLH